MLLKLSKEIWQYLLKHQIIITAENIPSSLNVEADWQSRNSSNPSEWKLCPKVFQQVCQRRGMPKIDLFASRLSHQLPQYFAWKPDPFSQGTDALPQIWSNQFLYGFPPFCLILQVLKKVSYDQTEKLLLVTPTWQSQIWYPLLLEMSIVRPLLLPRNTSLINPQGQVHPLIANRTLRLAVWTISGKDYLRREFQKQLPNLLQVQDEKVHSQITIRHGECGLAGVINNRLMHFDVM